MDDPLGVRVRQRIGEIAQNHRGACWRQLLLALENVAQALAVHAPHDEIQQPIGLAGGVHIDDARVSQARDRARFAQESLAKGVARRELG